jgi:polyhydroxybutyrate depolymerase
VSVLAINGTADRLVPFEGGGVGLLKKRGLVLSVAQTVAAWVRANGCTAGPDTVLLPDVDPDDGTRVRRETWTGGSNGSEVVLYTVDGGGHTWPDGTARARQFGRTCRDIDATELIWQFFQQHPGEE